MTIIDDWKSVLLKAWTVYLSVLATLAAFVEVVHADIAALVPILSPYLTDAQAAKFGAVCAALIPLARIVKQVSMHDSK